MANPANTTAYQLGDGRMAVDVTENKSLAITDTGFVQNCIGDVTVTIPATSTLGIWTIRNKGKAITSDGPDGAVASGNTLRIATNSSDKISGGVAGSAADNDQFRTTEAGAEFTVMNVNQTDGPVAVEVRGAWTRHAA